MKSKIATLLNSEGLRQSTIVTFANLSSTGISAIAFIILPRILGPVTFGVFSVGYSLILLTNRLADIGINMAMQKTVAQIYETDQNRANSLVSWAGGIKLAVSLGFIALAMIFSPFISQNWLNGSDVNIVRLGFALAFASLIFEYLQTVFTSIQKFYWAAFITIVQAVVKLVGTLALVLFAVKNALYPLLLFGLAPAIGFVVGLPFVPKWLRQPIFKDLIARQELLSVVKFTSIAIITAGLADNLDTLLVQHYLTSFDTGIFSAANRVALLFSVVGLSMGAVLNTRAAKYKDYLHLNKFFKKALLLGLIAIPAIGILIPFSSYLLLLTAGAEYLSGTTALQMLLVSSIAVVMTTPFIALFYSFKNSRYFAEAGILQTIILVVADVILIPQFGINGAAGARVIMRIFVLGFTFVYCLKLLSDLKKSE